MLKNDDFLMVSVLDDAIAKFHGSAMDAGWWSDPHTGEDLTKNPYAVTTKMMLIVGEIVEAMEAFRKDKMDDHIQDLPGVSVEIADALIRIFDLCGALNIDIGDAIMAKHVYNQERADHKVENRKKAGGKKF